MGEDSATVTDPQDRELTPSADTIWCRFYECYKFIKVCDRCRIRIKCSSYKNYWSPKFDF